jgi:WD40 repeat protein
MTQGVLGTPAFLSPEVVARGARQATVATDIYGLGAILYQLLTAHPPCCGATIADTLRAVQEVEPTRPGQDNPAVPADLETICLKCLEKEPMKRYGTAEALAEDLGRFLRNEPIRARPIGPAAKVWRWCRRKPVVAGLLLALHIAFALGLGGVFWQWRRAVAGELNARQRQYVSEMNLVQQAWDEGNLRRAQALLASYVPKPSESDLRGFEWRYLWRLCQDESRFSFTNFPSAVQAVLSPDGSLVAAASGNVIQLLEYANRRESATLSATNAAEDIGALAFAPANGNVLATASGSLLNFWNITDRRITATINLCQPSASLAISRDGNLLASVGGHKQTVELWRLEDRSLIWRRETETPVFGVLFAPDGQSLVSGGGGGWGGPVVWDLATDQSAPFPAERQGWINAMCFSPGGHVLATSSTDSTVLLWDFAERRLLGRLIVPAGGSSVGGVAFSADGRWLAAAYGDSTVRLWDVATRQQQALLRGHQASVISVAFLPGGHSLLSSSADGTVRLWDREPRSHDEFLGRDENGLLSNFSPDGRRLAWTDSEGHLKVWDVPGRAVVRLLPKKSGHPQRALFSPDGEVLAQLFNERVKLWDARALELRCELTNGFDAISLAFSPDSRILAIAGLALFELHGITNRLVFWDLASRRKINKLAAAAPSAVIVSFSHDGRRAAIGYLNGEVRVWDFESERLLAEFTDQRQRIWALAFSPDDTWLAAGGDEGAVVFYDLRARRAFRPVAATSTWVLGLCFTPDGKTLASAEGDGTIKLWNVATREVALTLQGHRGWVGLGSSFSADGNLLASDGPAEGTVRLWRAAAVDEIPRTRGDLR